jgi:hypothetical protein
MTVANRVRRFRERQKSGKAVLHIEVDLFAHSEMLIAAGLLKTWDDSDRSAIEEATARLLKTLATENGNA